IIIFFFQAVDGIRARNVTGVQTCALPIYRLFVHSFVVENSSATNEWTNRRLAEVQASPPLRIFAWTAPATALSISASSQTTNGALPPSSIEVFMTLRSEERRVGKEGRSRWSPER